MVKDESYINIQGWMINKLGLKGNDLIVYAIIYGFSQDMKSSFKGSQQYLADWCNCTTRGIRKNLDYLVANGFIKVVSHTIGGIVEYSAVPLDELEGGTEQSSEGGRNKVPKGEEQSSANNIDNTIELEYSNTISKDIVCDPAEKSQLKKESPKKLNLYDKCVNEINEYTEDNALREVLVEYLKLRLAMKDKPMYGVSQFRGILKKLDNFNENPIDIVNYCIERGYASFYAPNVYNNKRSGKVDKSVFGEDDTIHSKKLNEEEKRSVSSGITF